MESASQPEVPRRMNWVTIVVSGLVTLIVSVSAGMLIFYLQSRTPHLVYSASETIPFTGQNKVVAVYQVAITNEGKSAVEGVDCVISIAGATVEETRVQADPALKYSTDNGKDSVKVNLTSLNPGESAQISVLATGLVAVPTKPKVSLRGKGVAGEEKSPTKPGTPVFLGFTTSLAAALAFAAVTLGVFYVRTRNVGAFVFEPDSEFHSDDQREILAYVYRMTSLNTLADEILRLPKKTAYWAEADRLAQSAIDAKDTGAINQADAALQRLLEYARISDTSRAIVLFNLAKLNIAVGKTTEAKMLVDEALKIAPKLIRKRVGIDPQASGLIAAASPRSQAST